MQLPAKILESFQIDGKISGQIKGIPLGRGYGGAGAPFNHMRAGAQSVRQIETPVFIRKHQNLHAGGQWLSVNSNNREQMQL